VRQARPSARSSRRSCRITAQTLAEPPVKGTPASSVPASQPSTSDPWSDSKWQQYKWTVYRGKAYDLTSFMDRHPAGSWLLNLAIGRDCTALFESSHLRPDVAVANLRRLPVLEDFPIDAVPRSPYPNDSDLYNTIRERVRKEVFKGEELKGAHRSGSEGAALCVLGFAAATYAAYVADTSALTGALLGVAGAWIGLTIQHCGNHGAMSTKPWVNGFLGMCNDLAGGSSLMWRYHHQVRHPEGPPLPPAWPAPGRHANSKAYPARKGGRHAQRQQGLPLWCISFGC
jgi:acyl-lipid (7-3)-desaturase (Delta-4 desaturase)